MRICDYTDLELRMLKSLCNFTPREEELFDLRSREYSIEDCAEMMHISPRTASRINKGVKRKIFSVNSI